MRKISSDRSSPSFAYNVQIKLVVVMVMVGSHSLTHFSLRKKTMPPKGRVHKPPAKRAVATKTRARPMTTVPPKRQPKVLRNAISNADNEWKAHRAHEMDKAWRRGDPNWKYVNRWELPKNRPKAERDAWRRTHDPTYGKPKRQQQQAATHHRSSKLPQCAEIEFTT